MIRRTTMTDWKIQEVWDKVRKGPYIDSTDEAGLYHAYLNVGTAVFVEEFGIMRIEADGKFHGFAWSSQVFGHLDEIRETLDEFGDLYSIVPEGASGSRKFLEKIGFAYRRRNGTKVIYIRSRDDEEK